MSVTRPLNSRVCDPKRMAGVTLVELMVAMTIGLLISLAVSVLFSQVSQGFKTSDEGARAMENGRFALKVISEDLRMAGFVGLFNDPARIELARTDMIAGAAAKNCGSTQWPFQLLNANNQLAYIEHVATPSNLPCIASGSFVPGNPALVIRRASGIQATAEDLQSSQLFIQSNQAGAILFFGKDYVNQVKNANRHLQVCRYTAGSGTCTPSGGCGCPTTGANANKGSVALVDGPIFQYLVYAYYLRPCSRPAAGTCAASDDNGAPIPTLVRRQLSEADPAEFVEVPVAEGVERLSIAYGVDENEDGVPDRYVANPTDLGQAVTARITLLVRTRQQDVAHDDAAYSYTLADGSVFNCTTAGASCAHRRYLLSDTIQLKNYVIRR